MIKVYKVVRPIDGKHFSAMNLETEWSLEYNVGQTTYPKIGSLFAFETLEDAEIWVYGLWLHDYLTIWDAWANTKRGFMIMAYNPEDYEIFWNKFVYKQTVWRAGKIGETPKGTTLCDSIILEKPSTLHKWVLRQPIMPTI